LFGQRFAAIGKNRKDQQQEIPRILGGKRMRRMILAAAATAAVFMASGAAMAQAPIVIKFSHVVANDTPKGKGALKFKELAEKYTNGKVKIEVYPNSSLYKDKEEIEALQLGSVQMLAPSTAKFAPLGVKEFEALDLPWLFKDEATYAAAMKGPVGKWLFQKLESKGITGLAYWDNGFHMTSANRPLLMPADFQGLKIRISGSKIADRYFRDLGSIPQIMAFSEVYQALQTGVVDGCENTPSNYLTQKFHEVQKDITVSNHAHLQYAVIVNSKFWNGLPDDIRKQLDKAMDEATDYTNSIAVKENEDALAEIKKSGKTSLHYLTDDQRTAWQTAMRPTYAWAKGRVGQEVLDLLGKELSIKMN
jgi:C4-dicarboxylate-binding protein DctP